MPYSRTVWWLALAYLVAAGIYHRFNLYGSIPDVPFLPHNFQINEKPWVAAPRLAHILSLAYVIGHSPIIRWLRAAPAQNPLSLMGRHALPVFWLGTALSMVGQVLMIGRGIDTGAQLGYLCLGFAAQVGLAFGLERLARAEKERKAGAPSAVLAARPDSPMSDLRGTMAAGLR